MGKRLFDADRHASAAIVRALDGEHAAGLAREARLFADIDRALGGLFALALALVLGWFSLRVVTRPLAALGRAARAIDAGDLSHPVSVTGARAFTRLAVDMEVMRWALAAQRATLGASDARLHALVTHLPVILCALDADGIVTLYEGRGLAPLGVTPDAVVGRSYRDVYAGHPEIVEPLCQALNGASVSFLTTVSGLTFDARATPLRDTAGRVTGVIGVSVDVTARRRAEEALRTEVERRNAIIATQRDIAHAALDRAAVMTLVAARAQALTGADGAVVELVEGHEMVYRGVSGTAAPHLGLRLALGGSLSGLSMRTGELLRCDDTEVDARVDQGVCRRIGVRAMIVAPLYHERRPIGVLMVLASQTQAFDDATVEALELMAGLLTAALDHVLAFEAAQTLVVERTRLAPHDPLTGLPNRALFRDRLGQALAQARRRGGQMALLFLDLDGFKGINDTRGHEAGDRLLVETAARLGQCVREGDTAARLGGDEFTVILHEVTGAHDAAVVAQRLADALTQPVMDKGHALRVTVSIGIALGPVEGDDVDALLTSADAAMYAAKRRGASRGLAARPGLIHEVVR